jgi:hypothetical protein
MNLKNWIFYVGVPSLLVTPVAAAPVDAEAVSNAQSQLIARISTEMLAYATRIRVDPGIVGYCQGELYLRTFQHPPNGHVPFGVNYNQIRDSERLDVVISNRENYERWFLKLCIANAKLTLHRAAQ